MQEEAKTLVTLDAGGEEITASSTIQQLREDADEAENESMICKERETVLQLEVRGRPCPPALARPPPLPFALCRAG